VGRYRLIRQLGSGGMGAVHLAEHVAIQKRVAVKILHEERTAEQAQKERFLNEARAIARVQHPNIIDVSDYGETEDGRVFFVMEYLQGEDLKSFMRRKHFVSWKDAAPILLQMCAGLGAAHAAGVIHRDLKPDNIFLIEHQGEANFVKVLDFGLAKMINDPKAKKLTRTGIIVGTPAFIAPEQVLGKTLDQRADIYGLGLIFYRMLCARLPFEAKSVVEMLRKHVKEIPAPPSSLAPDADIPPALDDLVLRALAKNPEDRFPSMKAMGEALAAAESPSPKMTQPWTAVSPSITSDLALPGDSALVISSPQAPRQPTEPLAFEPRDAPTAEAQSELEGVPASFELSTERVSPIRGPEQRASEKRGSDGRSSGQRGSGSARQTSGEDLRPPVNHLAKVLMGVILVLVAVIVVLLLR